ncbi:MAG: cobaltochelatase subunit CobN [Pseudomonadota bacterium]
MHILLRETHSLDEGDTAVDLGPSAAPLILLSFSDSDLGAAANAWVDAKSRGNPVPQLRLANLQKLRHPLSVDLFVERLAGPVRCVVVRLLGGVDYWRYGIEETARACRAHGVELAVIAGDGRDDPRFSELSTVSEETRLGIAALFDAGGPDNTTSALRLMAHIGGLADVPETTPVPMPLAGTHDFGVPATGDRPVAAIVFYRSYLLAGDLAPLNALAKALAVHGIDVQGVYVTSLKEPQSAEVVRQTLGNVEPAVIINATGFSARMDDGSGSPLDSAGVPVLQVALSGARQEAWAESARGLGQADLAMQVVLPELDGRIFAGVISFKQEADAVAGLDHAWTRHSPYDDGIASVAGLAAGWARLSSKPRDRRQIAIVLSDYPGAKGQSAHAVGLDALASLSAILQDFADAGYWLGDPEQTPAIDTGTLTEALTSAPPALSLSRLWYDRAFRRLPPSIQERVTGAWGEPQDDPDFRDGGFAIRVVRYGGVLAAIQPDRGTALDRKASYHDPDLPPRHAYVAFYLWLAGDAGIDAMVHLGTHGTLEWLPGKAVAQSDDCVPLALIDAVPVLYPFIVNNPGEAATAKRRIGAVTIGHMTPPLRAGWAHGNALELEKRIDEYAAADGLDTRRMAILKRDILDRAGDAGLLTESGVTSGMCEDEQLARLDAYLCDVKDLQIRDGLHVYGRAPSEAPRAALRDALIAGAPSAPKELLTARLDASPDAERDALIAGLDGRFVAPGPAGAPTRGRADVLPTGRNLYTIDPRAVPTRSALTLAQKTADAIVARHVQDHGDWPRSWFVDLWGSTTIRTGGEDLALALLLMGVEPVWDDASNRVSGFEVLPLARLDRPRADVTLRISGLFRDGFAQQIALFDAAVRAVASRSDEDPDWNPLAAIAKGLEGDAFRQATIRIYGSRPGDYGAGLNDILARGAWGEGADLANAYLDASASVYGEGLDGQRDRTGLEARVAAADAFVHQQDHRELDLLEGGEYAGHEGGFAIAAATLGSSPTLYHPDTAEPGKPKVRTVAEEVRRVVRGRAANPDWLAGMMRHGYRGGAEMSRALDALFGFAATLPDRMDGQFDLVFDATLGDEEVDGFLRTHNPDARDAMQARFEEALNRGLWQPRRNSVAAFFEDGAAGRSSVGSEAAE